jgi:hypothetical protein
MEGAFYGGKRMKDALLIVMQNHFGNLKVEVEVV